MNHNRAGPAVFVRLFLSMGVILLGLFSGITPALARLTLYVPQPGIPAAIPNFINPGAGCGWWGVGGQVFNESGRPEPGMIVRVTGIVEGRPVNLSAVSGGSLGFGRGGFDLQVSDHIPTSAALNLQLYDAVGRAQSGPSPVPLYSACSQNLVVINLRQVSYDRQLYFPFARK